MGALTDFFQSASNAVASNVSAPVDGISWLMRKAGFDPGPAPIGGSDWMRNAGLTADVSPGAASTLGETAGMLAPFAAAAKAPQIARTLLQGADNLAAPAALNKQAGAVVWHGSPHQFDAFDASKIGTGEGAQAYGHGLYLADEQAVAQGYKEALSQPELHLKGRQIKTGDGTPMDVAKAWLQDTYDKGFFNSKTANPFDNALSQVQAAPVPNKSNVISAIERLKQSGATMDRGGNLYKVDLPDEHIAKMLDWDKPLSEQHPDVQAALKPHVSDYVAAKQADAATGWGDALTQPGDGLIPWATPRGSELHAELYKKFGNAQNTAEQLRQAGIPGIRYLDQGSRGAGAGSSNYVIFPGNEGALTIMERNGLPPAK